MTTKYMVTSGFLGSGKTTSMIAFANSINRRGLGHAAILANDLGASNIRKWLNSTFINGAFTQEEQNAIKSKTIKTPNNPVHQTAGGADTTDKIFLLSISEVTSKKYGFSTTYRPDDPDDTEKTVKPDVIAEGSELDAVNIETQVVGNGYAAGAGTYADQAKVTLTAKPLDDAAFGGWYESGKLISKETSFTFRAESGNDRNITAKFCEPIQGRSAKLSKTTYVYNGKSQTPAVTISGLKKGQDYTVSYSKNRYVGTATAKITGTGDYSGTITRTFRIIPKGTTIRTLSKAKKAFTVKWKKQRIQTTGYQIRYSLKSSMKSSKTVTITKNSVTSKRISKLKTKKKYYVQIRSYKSVNKVRYYSSWSSTKKVTTR